MILWVIIAAALVIFHVKIIWQSESCFHYFAGYPFGRWLVLIWSETKLLLAGCTFVHTAGWWLITDKPNEHEELGKFS
jgi:hypothetical protein